MKSIRRSVLVALLLWPVTAWAQITIPNSFVAETVADPDQVNANFNQLGTQALNRAGGGVITGNVSVNAGVTIDGIDIGAVLGGSGGPTFVGITITGTGASAIDVAGGMNAGSGNVGIVDTSGRIPALTTTYFASVDGSTLTNMSAAQLLTGTLPDARLSSNIPRIDALNAYTAAGIHSWTASTNGSQDHNLSNNSAGTAASSAYVLGNSADANRSSLRLFSIGFTSVGSAIPDSTRLRNVGAGGISLDATDASAPIRFYTGGAGALAGQFLSTRQFQLVIGGQLVEVATTPADPTSGTQMNWYLKGDNLVLQFNDGGTVRYKWLDLTGTNVTWQQSTSAP